MNDSDYASSLRAYEPSQHDLAVDDARGDWPLFGLTDDIRPALAKAVRQSESVVLATLYAAEGGAPRGVGAQMLFTSSSCVGYLSGGCIEADVSVHARAVMSDGEPRRLIYGRGGPLDIRLPCGGRIDILLERVTPGDPAANALLALADERRPALWITDGRERACGDAEAHPPSLIGPAYISRRFDPRQRLVVLGADPISLALCRFGTEMGYEVFLVRPKGPSSPPPIGGLTYLRQPPAEALTAIGLDTWTAVAIASHDDIYDHEAALFALKSDAAYVGLLGSRRRLPDKVENLRAAGVSQQAINRLHAPIGLPLGGRGPWEIATSIISEIIETAKGGSGSQARGLRSRA